MGPTAMCHVSKTTYQNCIIAKYERFQQFDGQRFLVFWFDSQNQNRDNNWMAKNRLVLFFSFAVCTCLHSEKRRKIKKYG